MGLLQGGEARRGTPRRSRRTTVAKPSPTAHYYGKISAIVLTATLLLLPFLGQISVFVDATHKSRFGIPFAPKTRLTWVNGIGYNTGHMEKEAPLIAEYFGGKKVEFYHNPTKMVDETDTRGYFSDLTQAGQQKYLGRITAEVNGLVEHLREAVRSVIKNNQNGIVVHIAHSQGALVTCLAAKLLTPAEMNKIEVISFGGATPVRSTPETPFKRCVNYYSVNDPLLFLNPSAESALRSGFGYHNNKNNEDEFCFLAPRVGDPIADHMLLGPTYASALEWEGKRFERKYQSYLERTVRYSLLTALSILSVILRLLSLVLVKLVEMLPETPKELGRDLVRSLAEKILAVRSRIFVLLAQIVAFVQSLWHNSPKATIAEQEMETPPPGSATTNSTRAPPLLGLLRKTKPLPEADCDDEMETGTTAALKSRWAPSRTGRHQK